LLLRERREGDFKRLNLCLGYMPQPHAPVSLANEDVKLIIDRQNSPFWKDVIPTKVNPEYVLVENPRPVLPDVGAE